MRVLATLTVTMALALGAGGCGTRQQSRPEATRGLAVVKIRSNVRDALVYVDGRFEATLDRMRGGIAVTPGVHRFELRHDDYFSSYLELTLQRAERKQVTMEMAPVLP